MHAMYRTARFIELQNPLSRILILVLLVVATMLLTFFLGVILVIPFFGTNVLDMLTHASSADTPGDIAILKFFQIVSQIGTFILPSIFFSILASNHFFRYLKIDNIPGFIPVLASALLIFTILPGINRLAEINEAMSLPDVLSGIENWMRASEESAALLTEKFLQTDSIAGLLLNLFMVAVLAAVGEELLFRGVLVRLLNDWFRSTHLAVWVSAILFSMFHLQFFGFLPRLVLGVVFGYLFVWSGSLWLPVLAHFINNGAAVLVYYFFNNGTTDIPVEDFGTIENSTLLIISLMVSVGLMMIIYYVCKKPPAVEKPQI